MFPFQFSSSSPQFSLRRFSVSLPAFNQHDVAVPNGFPLAIIIEDEIAEPAADNGNRPRTLTRSPLENLIALPISTNSRERGHDFVLQQPYRSTASLQTETGLTLNSLIRQRY
jgi:hypothetical protein